MDIHSIISPLLMILTVVCVCMRSYKDDETAISEIYVSVITGAVLLLIGIVFLHIVVFTIILNIRVNIDNYITPRILFLCLHHYFTLIYSVVVILFIRCENE